MIKYHFELIKNVMIVKVKRIKPNTIATTNNSFVKMTAYGSFCSSQNVEKAFLENGIVPNVVNLVPKQILKVSKNKMVK